MCSIAESRTPAQRLTGVIAAAIAGALIVAAPASVAESLFGNRPVTLIVPGTPGTGSDEMARVLAMRLSRQLGTDVIVENRPGAGTQLALDYVARSAPDGRTLLLANAAAVVDLAANPHIRPNVLDDVVPVSRVATSQVLLVVRNTLGVDTVGALVARARQAPGALNYATPGVMSTMRIAGELFKLRTGTDIVQIPYRGEVQEMAGIIAGTVDMAFVTLPSALSFVKSKQVRALAVAGHRRSPLLPDVPTLAESGVDGVVAEPSYGLLASVGTPRDVVDALARLLRDASASSDYRNALAAMGVEPSPSSPAEFGAMLRDDVAKYRAVIEAAHISAQ